jgi:transcriptional regulator of acetoin/glycerol metabolism
LKMLVAYRGQGARVTQIAEAFDVHRSTIYRKLKNEPVLNGTQGHSNC